MNTKVEKIKNGFATIINSVALSYQKVIIFLVIFLLSILFIVISQVAFGEPLRELFGDAETYWWLAEYGFELEPGNWRTFSLDSFPEIFRGYFLPLLFYLSSLVGKVFIYDSIHGFFLLNSIVVALLVSVLLPSMFSSDDTPPPPIKFIFL